VKGKRAAVARALEATGLSALLRRVGAWRGLLVLNYHRLARGPEALFDTNIWSATPEDFDEQVATIKRYCDLVAPGDLAELHQRRAGRSVLLTFDDGYRDNHDLAFPILRAHGAKAVFFPVTAWVDEPRVPGWDEIGWLLRHTDKPPTGDVAELAREWQCHWRTLAPVDGEAFLDQLAQRLECARAARDLAAELWLTWDQIRAMSADGQEFGGHTAHHVCLASVDAETQHAEINGCRERLEAELGKPVTWFSYPFGARSSFNTDTAEALRANGVRWVASQYGGWHSTTDWDPYDLRRTPVHRGVVGPVFRALLTLPQAFASG